MYYNLNKLDGLEAQDEHECERAKRGCVSMGAERELELELEREADMGRYSILGLISRAYKRASLWTHPDKSGSDAAFRAVTRQHLKDVKACIGLYCKGSLVM